MRITGYLKCVAKFKKKKTMLVLNREEIIKKDKWKKYLMARELKKNKHTCMYTVCVSI